MSNGCCKRLRAVQPNKISDFFWRAHAVGSLELPKGAMICDQT